MTKTLEERLGVNGTLVMGPEDVRTYAFGRKLHPDKVVQEAQTAGIREVVIHNAKTAEEVRRNLASVRIDAQEYTPLKSNEVHFYVPNTGTLHVVNPRGVIRLKRDQQLVHALSHVLGRDLGLLVDHYTSDEEPPHRFKQNESFVGEPSRAQHRFEHFAYKIVADVCDNLDRASVVGNSRLNLLLGPHSSLNLEDVVVEHGSKNDYLNFRILRIGDEVVVNFDYIFADQARNILHKLCSVVSAEFEGAGVDINIFHYGKIGILNQHAEIGQIVVPTGAMEEHNLQRGVSKVFPIHNQLVSNLGVADRFTELVGQMPYEGITVNTISVLGQTRESLEAARRAGGRFLDMEWLVMSGIDIGAESLYPNLGAIRYFFAGVGSDKPLAGQTLGNTSYAVSVERKVANALATIIRELPKL